MVRLQNIIKGGENYELSGEDIKQYFPDSIILPYHKLNDINDINEIFNNTNTLFLLYETKENYGHWSVLNKMGNNIIEFFDPYGFKMDQEIKFSKFNLKDNKIPHLTALFNNSNYKVVSNIHRFQKWKTHINTCGRHCIVRTKFIKYSLSEYISLFKNSMYDSDYWVTALTIINSI